MLRAIALCFIFMVSASQVCAQEMQITFDEAGKYTTITQQLESRVRLFTEYPTFREANIFQVAADQFVLEITYLKEGRLVRDRKNLNKTEFEAFRTQFEASAIYQIGTAKLNQEGRALFLSTTTTWSAGFYGYMIPSALEFNQRQLVGTWMLITGTSFYLPFIMTKDVEITKAQAKATYYGATRSILHGASLYYTLTGDSGTFKGFILTSAGLSLAEMYGGYQFAKSTQMSEGRAEAIGLYADYGLFAGYLTTVAFTGELNRVTTAMALMGAGVGMYSGIQMTKAENISLGDVNLMYGTTFLGAYSLASIANILSNNDERLVGVTAAFGAGLGLLFGAKTAVEYDFSKQQGNYILYSTFAGFATGYGAAYSFFGSLTESNLKPYAVLGTLGGLGGYYVMFNYLSNDAKILKNKEMSSAVSFDVNPIGIASFIGGSTSKMSIPTSYFNLKISF